MILLIVNFHYFGDEYAYKSGIYPVSGERFSHQLDMLAEHFSFISQGELIAAVDGNNKLPEDSCLITFDDGLHCQYEVAFPILMKKSIPAVFFVGSLPYTEYRTCLVHKIHYLLANSTVNDISNAIGEFLKIKNPRNFLKEIETEAQAKYRYDDPITASIKMALNTEQVFDLALREKIVSVLFSQLVADEKKFTEELYLSKEELRLLYHKGFLGLHSHSHLSLAMMQKEEMKKDLLMNKKVIENLVGGEISSVSFPYGGGIDINSKVLKTCEHLGFKVGFTMERSFNNSLVEPFLFARLDTNDSLGGKNPRFEFIEKEVHILQGMTRKRSLFFKE